MTSASDQGEAGGISRRRDRLPRWVLAGALYLVAAVIIWWHVWTGHPRSTMTCECGDPASFVWYLAWPAYALSHGHSLFFSTRVHFPAGINLLDNTSVLALGVVLAPVTWLFGPVATLNAALTAAPALTALASYGFLRGGLRLRWPAAFLGGLLFGFSPFVLHQEAVSHLQLTFLAAVPLIFWACYELTVTQRGRWWLWGLLLGVSVAVQFFIGTEILTIAVLTILMALALTVVAGLWHDRTALSGGLLASRLPFAAKGFGSSIAVAAVLLAYPFYYSVTGPEHITGSDWAQPSANSLLRMLLPLKLSNYDEHHLAKVGYLGVPGALPGYIGLFALAALLIALIVVRRPLIRLCAVMTVICLWLSLGAISKPLSGGGEPSWLPLPWHLVSGLPVLNKLAPASFSVPALWFTVVAGAVLVDQLLARRLTPDSAAAPSGEPAAASFPGTVVGSRRSAVSVAAAVVVAAALVVPWLLSWQLPYVTESAGVGSWASQAGNRLPSTAVVLFYPYPATTQDRALVWQAMTGMPYSVAGGRGIVVGPGGVASHGLPGSTEAMMGVLLTAAAVRKLPAAKNAADVLTFRAALRRWGVTDVIVTTGVPHAAYARTWFSAVLGSAPTSQDGAWVWHGVQELLR